MLPETAGMRISNVIEYAYISTEAYGGYAAMVENDRSPGFVSALLS